MQDCRPGLPTTCQKDVKPAIHLRPTCPLQLQTAVPAHNTIQHRGGRDSHSQVGHPVARIDVDNILATTHIAGEFWNNTKAV